MPRPQLFLGAQAALVLSSFSDSAPRTPTADKILVSVSTESPARRTVAALRDSAAPEVLAVGAARGAAEQPAPAEPLGVHHVPRSSGEILRKVDPDSNAAAAALGPSRSTSAIADAHAEVAAFPSIQEIISAMSRPVDSPLRPKRPSNDVPKGETDEPCVAEAALKASEAPHPPHACNDVKKLRRFAEEPCDSATARTTVAEAQRACVATEAACTPSATFSSGAAQAAAAAVAAEEDADIRAAIALSLAHQSAAPCDRSDQCAGRSDSATSAPGLGSPVAHPHQDWGSGAGRTEGDGACGLIGSAAPPTLSVKGTSKARARLASHRPRAWAHRRLALVARAVLCRESIQRAALRCRTDTAPAPAQVLPHSSLRGTSAGALCTAECVRHQHPCQYETVPPQQRLSVPFSQYR